MIRKTKRTLRKRTCRRGGNHHFPVGMDSYVGGSNYKRTARRKARGGGNEPNDGSVEWYNRRYGTNYKH